MPLASVYNLVWFGSYTRFNLFSFSLGALVVFHLQVNIHTFHLFFGRSRCQSSICTSIILLRFIIRTYTPFLSWTTSTYHIHSYPQSLSFLLSSLHHLFLNALSFAPTCITYIIPMYRSIIHAFPDIFILQVLIHAFLNNCILQYTSCGLGW